MRAYWSLHFDSFALFQLGLTAQELDWQWDSRENLIDALQLLLFRIRALIFWKQQDLIEYFRSYCKHQKQRTFSFKINQICELQTALIIRHFLFYGILRNVTKTIIPSGSFQPNTSCYQKTSQLDSAFQTLFDFEVLSNNHGLLLVKGQGSDIHFSDTVTYSGYDSYLSCIFNFVEVRSCWQHLYSDILEANFHILFVFHSIFVVAHFIPPFFAHIFIFVVFPSLKFTFPSLYSFFQLSRLMGFFDHLNFAVFRTHDHYHMYIPFLNQIALPILNSFLFVSLLLLSFFKIMLLQILKVRLQGC